jgi:D-sedoheptulose 7-phosphate isomerase
MALTTDSSALTCIGNDYSFADIFARQLIGLGRAGDCLLGISTSGNSENIIRAVEAAREIGVVTVCLLGRDGGHLANAADHSIIVPDTNTARIQEAHIFIGHTICQVVERQLIHEQRVESA